MEWSAQAKAAAIAYGGHHAAARVALGSDTRGAVIAIGGWLGLEESIALHSLLDTAVDSMASGDRLSLDLSAVSYISSTGVGALSGTLVLARRKNVELVIGRLSGAAARILDNLGILDYFKVERIDA